MVKENVQGYKDAGIPLEGVWLDIPYMADGADFSVDTTSFDGVKEFTDELHTVGQRMVVIVDAGISADDPTNTFFS